MLLTFLLVCTLTVIAIGQLRYHSRVYRERGNVLWTLRTSFTSLTLLTRGAWLVADVSHHYGDGTSVSKELTKNQYE